jgi:hypothetical protein
MNYAKAALILGPFALVAAGLLASRPVHHEPEPVIVVHPAPVYTAPAAPSAVAA